MIKFLLIYEISGAFSFENSSGIIGLHKENIVENTDSLVVKLVKLK